MNHNERGRRADSYLASLLALSLSLSTWANLRTGRRCAEAAALRPGAGRKPIGRSRQPVFIGLA